MTVEHRAYAIVCEGCNATMDVVPTEPCWFPVCCPCCGSYEITDVSAECVSDGDEPLDAKYAA